MLRNDYAHFSSIVNKNILIFIIVKSVAKYFYFFLEQNF